MDARLAATPSGSEIADALRLWPELAGLRVRPLLVTAFGDIYVETETKGIFNADPIALTCEPVAASVSELEELLQTRLGQKNT